MDYKQMDGIGRARERKKGEVSGVLSVGNQFMFGGENSDTKTGEQCTSEHTHIATWT